MKSPEWIFHVIGIVSWVMLMTGLWLSVPERLKRECRDLILLIHMLILIVSVLITTGVLK